MSEEFYAGLIGSFVALLGVLITLYFGQRQHEQNLVHERLKLKEEREFTARQAALIDAASAIVRFTQYFLSIPDRDIPAGGATADELLGFGVASNRLHFYCSQEIIEAATKLGKELNVSYGKAIQAKMPSMFLAEDIKVLDLQIQNLERLNEAIQQEISALLQSKPESQQIAAHRNQLAIHHRTISELHGLKAAKFIEKYHATESCRDEMKRAIKGIYVAQLDFLILARRELGFDIDGDRYAKFMNEQTSQMIIHLESLIDDIRAKVRHKLDQ